ncbi:MAG: LamG-like jellyroll fold domain-containing protein, partial [Bacteroidota bacterium]
GVNIIYYKFSGTYNGKGHAIDSIYINRPRSNQGFFGLLQNATIDSLNVTNVSIIGGGNKIGGLAGNLEGNTNISYCSSSGNVSSSSATGYLQYIGGLVGDVISANVLIKYCYSSAKASCNSPNYSDLGGLVGHNGGHITQCYSTGLVTIDPAKLVSNRAGGFVGYQVGIVDSSYWDIETSGQATGGKNTDTTKVHGRTTAQMKVQSTYVGWDFTNRWFISPNANNGYPCFYYPLSKISTQAVTNISTYSATAHGNIESKGTLNILSYGVCYNTTGSPTVADSKVNLGTTNNFGAFSANMSGLHHGTTYYVRAYAINERDTVYGEQVNYSTTNVSEASTCLNNGDQFNYISIPNNSTLQLTNNYSIEVWLKPGVAVSTNRIIVSKGYNANGYTLLSSGSGNQRGLIFDGMSTADNILTQNQWCHVAAVNENGTRHLYLNGVEMPLTGTPVSITANTQPLYLSNYDNGGSSNCFRGYIEEVRLWNTAKTYSQIRENMHLPLSGSETGLVSYWQFDEGQPPTVYDKKGVNNGTWYTSVVNQYISSSIPFGSGFSNTQVVSTTGTTSFANTGLSMNFTQKSSIDTIVVTRIDSFPNINPTEVDAVFDRQYWAVHKYGLGGYTANLTFTLTEDLTASDESQPARIKLYTRTSATDDSWTYLASASSVNVANHRVTFNGLNNTVSPTDNDPTRVTYLGQYIIAREQCLVNIPDANLKAALLAIPGLDANSDGKIQCTEATAFTGDIDVNAKTIADMTGIEAFSNITKLYCSNNNLTSLNISSLTLLTDLDCSYNQLTALNITSNTALVNFSCANNLLTSLNVSGLASLNYLVCRYNQLTSLDVSSNSALIGLQCNNNSLTGLNVSGLTSLSNINCGVNQLTNLDFSTNTGITKLGCDYNSLTSLNVKNGHNTNMSGSNFYAANNPGLTCIQVDNASWSTTNWTHKDAGASYSTDCSCVNPIISNQSTATQTQCLNGTFTPITVTAAGTNLIYQWYSNTIATTSGGTAVGTNSNSYTPLATTVGTLYYYCNVSGDCGTTQTTTISGAFIVNPATVISGQATPAQNQCLNGTFTPINVTATGTNLSYQWYSNATNSTTGGTSLGSANGANTYSYTPQATIVGTLYYYCVVTGSCGTPTSNISGAIIVNPATAINSQSTATQTQILNGTFTAITVTATGTNLIYQWYSNATASNTGGTSLGTGNGANTYSYTPQATTVGTLYYYCVVTGSCGTTQTSAVSGAFIVNPGTGSQVFAKQGAGVTLIIHGWNPDGSQPAWMQPMANAIVARSGGIGQIGTITVTGTKGNLTATCSNWNYNLATATSGEIVVLVNWTAVSNHLTTGITAQEVAATIAPKIYQSQNAQPALSELPIHLIGHSRGGGMAYEIARLLGLQGIEVEQVTSLDPHPLTASDPQGTPVPIGPGSTIDTPIQIYQNILFADNYYQNIAYPTGLSLTGAYNRLWTSLPGGYHNQVGYTYNILGTSYNFSDHLNIILAYHGTIDLATPVSNVQATMTTTERAWFNTYENTGQNTGFVYSRDIAGNRKSTDIPNSGNAIIAGYNNNSTLGGSGARATLTWTSAVWPNVITSVAVKSSVELSAGTQTIYNNDALQFKYTYRSYTNASAVTFYLDIDRNPYNNNNSATIGTQNFSSTASSIIQSTLAWTVSDLITGTKYYVYAKISDGTHTRYQYLDYEFSMACIVNIPDANFKAALLAISGLDANNNGNIECSEATAWTGSIDVSAKSISDLTGIASFTNITELNCGDNQLTSLNISSNTALIGLSCYGNNLTSLNVNSLTSLTGLSCSFNQLTSLDLSSNTVLRNLYCGDNSITTLNVSANASLKSIYCDNNLLISLNVQNGNNHYFDDFNASSNTGLTCIQVDNVAWSNANWSHKDAGASYSTNCTPPCIVNIPDASFKAALLANVTINTNNDGEIQCSEATAYTGTINVDAKGIADLSGIESFTNITNLICSNNNLSALNVSGLTSLNELACNINQLANLNLSSNTALTKLDCSSNALTSLNVSGLTQLVDLYCYNNQLTNLNVLSNTAIEFLECDQNLLTSLDVSGLTSLYYVTCYNNQLTTLDFSSNTLLEGLYCNDNLLTSLNLKNGNNTILPGWDFDATNNPGLSCIQVDNVAWSTSNWTQIDAGASFSTNCTPCIVNIPDANFKAALLADVTINTNNDGEIQCSEASAYTGQLDVGSQNINNLTGIEAFTNITYLSCNPNNLTALDVSANTLLTYLDCSSNSLTSLDLTANTALQELYCKFNSLTSLNVTGLTSLNHIDCISNLYTSLSFISNTNLQYLNCESNSLTSLNVAGLTSLTYLDCSANQLTSLAVSSNTALQILYCRNNLLSSLNVSGLTALSDFDCSYNQLTGLDVSTNTALQTLYCGNNLLSSLNVSGLTTLSDFDCSYNQLTNLNVLSNTNLFEIHCESNLLTSMNVLGLSSLSNLVCNDNQLTAIDVSSNTALSGLSCHNNLLTSLNVKNGNNINFESIDTRNNPNLTCIQVDDAAYSTANWTFIDAGASYSTNCAATTHTLNLKLFLEGLFDMSCNTMVEAQDIDWGSGTTFSKYGSGVADKINVELWEAFPPYTPVVSLSGIDLATNGQASFQVSASLNRSFYIKVSSRNHLSTWSASAVSFNTSTIVYDFTTNALNAYQAPGGNDPQIQVAAGKYAFYLGDLDQSLSVDFDDFNVFEPYLNDGTYGFTIADYNGNGLVDFDDFNVFEPRLNEGPFSQYPGMAKK